MIWLDAQLSPYLAQWITDELGVECVALRDIGLRDSVDELIFIEAKKANVIIITKDSDFVDLLYRLKSPPKIIWLTCGNTSNTNLKTLFSDKLLRALEIINIETDLVEIR